MNLTFIFGVIPVRKDGALNPTLSKMNIILIIPAIPVCQPLSQPKSGQAGMASLSNGVKVDGRSQ
jgi:hypothetical protein